MELAGKSEMYRSEHVNGRQTHICCECRRSLPSAVRAAVSVDAKPRKAVVVGAGPAGSLAAIYLAKLGWKVEVYEQRVKPSSDKAATLRSYTIALGQKALAAIQQVTDGPDLSEYGYKYLGFVNSDKKTIIPTIETKALMSRSELSYYLICQAEQHFPEAIRFAFDMPCMDVDLARRRVKFASADSSSPLEVGYDLLVGADGSRSAVRQAMMLANPQMTVHAFDSPAARLTYKTFHNLPPEHVPSTVQDDQPGAPGRILTMVNNRRPGRDTNSLFIAPVGPSGSYDGIVVGHRDQFEGLKTPQEHEAMLRETMPSISPEWARSIAQQLPDAPINRFGVGQLVSHFVGDSVVLLGDAAHPMTPAVGQGATSALEDCAVLAAALQRQPDSVQVGLQDFEASRRPVIHDLVLLDNIYGWSNAGDRVAGQLSAGTKLRMRMCQLQVSSYILMARIAHKLLPGRVPKGADMRLLTISANYTRALLYLRLSTAAVLTSGAAAAGLLLHAFAFALSAMPAAA